MTIQTKFLYDLGSRNTFQVLQEALDMTFMANLIQIFGHPDGNEQKKHSILLKWASEKSFFTFEVIPRVSSLFYGQKKVKTVKIKDFDKKAKIFS